MTEVLQEYPGFAPVLTLLQQKRHLGNLKSFTAPEILHFVMEQFPDAAMQFATKENVLKPNRLGWNALSLAGLRGRLDWIEYFSRLGALSSNLFENAWGSMLTERLDVLNWFLQRCDDPMEMRNVLTDSTWNYEQLQPMTRYARLIERNNLQTIQTLLHHCPDLSSLFVRPRGLCHVRSVQMLALLRPTPFQLNAALQTCFQEGSFVSQMTTLVQAGAVFEGKGLIQDCCQHIAEFSSPKRYDDVLEDKQEEVSCVSLAWPLVPHVAQMIRGNKTHPAVRGLPPFFRLYLAYWISTVLLRQQLPSVLARKVLDFINDNSLRNEFWGLMKHF